MRGFKAFVISFIAIVLALRGECAHAVEKIDPADFFERHIRPLLADPNAKWDEPAVTTYLFQNHAVRTERWRYIRYANGDEELYNEKDDPFEWTNLATKHEFASKKTELGKYLPTKNHADIGGKGGAEDFGDKPEEPAKKAKGK